MGRMMHWSRYNTLFHSQRFGYFLFNALSNTFFELDEPHYRFLEKLQNNPKLSNPDIDDQFLRLLREKKILVKENEEKGLLMTRQYRRNALCFDTANLGLTICPTLGCNFRCPYCFEHSQHSTTVMNPETVYRLIHFIKSFKNASHLSIIWSGGEPTLPQAFKAICDITPRIKELDITFDDAHLNTNAYLLDRDKINSLNDLNIKTIQITLDGPEEVHDTRRVLAGGKPTFQRIMANIDALMNSSFEGSCSIRVNVDKNNQHWFLDLRTSLLEQFKGKHLSVYAGHVITARDHTYDHSCKLCAQEWSDFTIGLYRISGLAPTEPFYPDSNAFDTCTANSHNEFVIGPEGELYKCGEDAGRQEMVIGSIFEDEPITNPELLALYSVGTDPYLDAECRECKVLPICGGGCANKRLRAKHFHEEGLEFCSRYKDNLVMYLEAYYDTFLTKEICRSVLNPAAKAMNQQEYRMVQPEKKKKRRRNSTLE